MSYVMSVRRSAAALLISAFSSAMALAEDTSQLKLYDSLQASDFAPEGGLFYKKNEEQSAGTVTFQSEADGHKALKLSVEAKCAAQKKSCSERAEVWEKPEVLALYDKPLWYAFSMMLDRPVPTVRHRYVMAQWKREIIPGANGDYSPFLGLRLLEGRLLMTVDTDEASYEPMGTPERPDSCKPGEALASEPDDYNQVRILAVAGPVPGDPPVRGYNGCTADLQVTLRGNELPPADSGWVDFIFMVKPGPSGDGHIEIAANGKWVATVKGHIGHQGPGLDEHQYFKFGPYRAGQPEPWTIFYRDFKRGPQCTDVSGSELCGAIR